MNLIQAAIEPLLHSDEPALQAAGRFYGHIGAGLDNFAVDELLLETRPVETLGGVTLASATFISYLISESTIGENGHTQSVIDGLTEMFKATLEGNLKGDLK